MKRLYLGLWEYCFGNYIFKWINVCKPPQIIFKLGQIFSKTIISNDKNIPENNFIEFTINLKSEKMEYNYLDKYQNILKIGVLKW